MQYIKRTNGNKNHNSLSFQNIVIFIKVDQMKYIRNTNINISNSVGHEPVVCILNCSENQLIVSLLLCHLCRPKC